ncbi:MAG: hypothetical protein SGCHY_001822 [Lobulomycetales sp.]
MDKLTALATMNLMHPGVVAGGCAFYCLVLVLGWPRPDAPRPNPSSAVFKSLVLLHNILLAVFSAYIFARTAPQFLWFVRGYPSFDEFLAGAYRGASWEEFSFYAWLFYLSKYYEFIDTFIVLAKGGKPIALQIFHHLGAVTSMWLLVLTKVPGSMDPAPF